MLDQDTREDLSPAFGDLSDLRVHTDASAAAASRALGAPAFTIGRELFFAEGVFAPGSPAGRHIIAHEAAHAVQQRGATPTDAPSLGHDEAAEQDARRAADGGVRPLVEARQARVMAYSRTGKAADLVAEFKAESDEWWTRAERAPALGAHLFEVASEGPATYQFVVEVAYALETGAERKNSVGGFIRRAGTAGLDELARTDDGRWLLVNLRNLLDFASFMGSTLELPDRIAIDDALGRGEGRNRAEATLEAAARRAQTAELPTPEVVDPAQIDDRLRLIRLMLANLRARYPDDIEVEPAVTAVELDLDARFASRPGATIDFEADARQVAMTQLIVERCVRSLAQFDEMLRRSQEPAGPAPGTIAHLLAIVRGEAPAPRAPSGTDPLEFHFLALAGRVRGAWVAALQQAMTGEGARLLAVAEAQSVALRQALDQLYLGGVASHVGYLELIRESVDSMTGWANWVREQIEVLNAELDGLADARRAGAEESELKERSEHVQSLAETIRLSIEGIQVWEHAVRAHEQIHAGTGWLAKAAPHVIISLHSAALIRSRCQWMKDAALGGERATLRMLAEQNRTDPELRKFFQAVPLFIAGANVLPSMAGELLLAFGILKVSAMASSAVGRLVPAVEGAFSRATLAQLSLEALTFTAVSRTLQWGVGASPKVSFLLDLALNAGLFGVMRFTGSMIHAGVTERGFEVAGLFAGHAANLGILQVFGLVHFRLEHDRWPTADEFAAMPAENLIFYAALARTKASPARARRHSRLAVLEELHGRYAERLEGIEEARTRLAARIHEELSPGRADDPATKASLTAAKKALEQEVRQVVDEITGDPVIVEQLRTELKELAVDVEATATELLTRTFDLPAEVGLRRAGEAQYTYAAGATELVVESLEAKHATVSEDVDATGLRTVVAEPPGQPPMFFAERPGSPAPEPASPRRRMVPSPPPRPVPPPKPKRVGSKPKGEVFDPSGGLTSQGVTVVRQMRGKRNLTPDQANMEVASNPAALERVVKEHHRRAINRGELSGKLIAGDKNILEYAEELPLPDPKTADKLEQATIDFLNQPGNAALRGQLVERLAQLRDALNMPADSLPNEEISQDPWTAAGKLRAKAAAARAEPQLQRAAEDFVVILGNSIGALKPDMIIWDPATRSLTVIDATHTLDTPFQIFHEFKTTLYARIFETVTGLAVKAVEFRSPREQRVLKAP